MRVNMKRTRAERSFAGKGNQFTEHRLQAAISGFHAETQHSPHKWFLLSKSAYVASVTPNSLCPMLSLRGVRHYPEEDGFLLTN